MKILLVTLTDLLPTALGAALNPANEYCAIIVDDVQPARQILEQTNFPAERILPFYDLKECLEDFYYDFVLCVSDGRIVGTISKHFSNLGLPRDKYVHVCLTTGQIIERALNYYEKHAADFEMFATGLSYVASGLDMHQFKRKMINFGSDSQDLYYDYQIAKRVLTPKAGGGIGQLRYALIGLGIQSFHFDLSKSYSFSHKLLRYLIPFDDLHNFCLPTETYKNLFNPKFLAVRMPPEVQDLNNLCLGKTDAFMNLDSRLKVREITDIWNRTYPETCKENTKILDDYLALCENNNVRPIIFLMPFSYGAMKHMNKRLVDELRCIIDEAQKKYPAAIFFDSWRLNVFEDRDFCDSIHLNIHGAAKFSAILNSFIERFDADY